MKKFILAGLAALTFNAFGQSFVIMDNGLIITTDTKGFVYDIGDYAFPLKVTMKGGKYFVEDNNVIATIDENGYLFRKYEVIPENILGKGMNYFLSATGEIYTIDNKGVVHLTSNEAYKTAANFGGNYFTVKSTTEAGEVIDLYVVKKSGEVIKSVLEEGLKMSDVVAFGGSYFMTNRGVMYTVTAEGIVMNQSHMRLGVLQKRGGNFFTDSTGMLYTVAEDGLLKLPGLPVNLRVNTIAKMGSNYFLDLSGRLYTVDKDGNIWEKMLEDHDFRNARIISL